MKKTFILKSCSASLLISLGVYILLTLNNFLGAILFAFGLLGVCYLGLNLFTGKCGFLFEAENKKKEFYRLIIMLIFNLISGYIIGLIFSYTNPNLISIATERVFGWSLTLSYFLKSLFCGIIMYFAVKIYKLKSTLGIIYGIPLFILCGFQHCIANVIILGIARTFDLSIIICIVGNFLGSLVACYISNDGLSLKRQ